MVTHKELLINWLNNVYSLEELIIDTLEGHLVEAAGYPELQTSINQHLKRVYNQLPKLESCIERLDSKPQVDKAKIAAALRALSQSVNIKEDKVIKNMILDYGLRCLEIASYKTLISMALHFGDQETVSICHFILKEEGQSARHLDHFLPQIIQDFVHEVSPKED